MFDQRRRLGIGYLRLACADIEISQGGWPGQNALFQTPVEALLRFLPKVADEVGGNHCLDVGGQSAATGIEVQTFISEVDFDALVDHLGEVGPVLEVAGGAVNLWIRTPRALPDLNS